ncbi:MAG: GNAT family N-acetyltransferase [Crenarchaeota archaeon]|nr:GNAT family N-acetyltransferase [Thermoproteota archaeon]
MRIRTADQGDLDEIAEVLRNSFKIYNCINIDSDYLEKLFRTDDTVSLDSTFVVEEDNRIVSVTMIVEREIRTVLGWIPFAGIANVATHPKYRGRGYASKLLSYIEDHYRDKEYPIIGLLAGYGEPAHRIYRRRGFHDIAYYRERILVLEDIKNTASMLKKKAETASHEPVVKPITPANADTISMLYNEMITSRYYGVFKRSTKRWKGILETGQYATWFLGKNGMGWLYDYGGRKAYSLVYMFKESILSGCKDPSAAYILEIAADNRHYPLILADTLDRLYGMGAKTIYYRPPPDKEHLVEKNRLIIPDETLMAKPCNPEKLRASLEEKFAKTTIIEEHNLHYVMKYPAGTIKFTPDSLLRIILGVTGAFEEYFNGGVKVQGNYRILLEEFSSTLSYRPHYIIPTDKW